VHTTSFVDTVEFAGMDPTEIMKTVFKKNVDKINRTRRELTIIGHPFQQTSFLALRERLFILFSGFLLERQLSPQRGEV
jgi:hypothetical protein